MFHPFLKFIKTRVNAVISIKYALFGVLGAFKCSDPISYIINFSTLLNEFQWNI